MSSTLGSTPNMKMCEELQTQVSVATLNGLKHVGPPVEKNVLPTKQDLEEERKHEQFKQGIEQFEKSELTHVNTNEKVVLPTTSDIAVEKAPQMAAEFDHTALKHVEPVVKSSIIEVDE